jgi:hypothetical protein
MSFLRIMSVLLLFSFIHLTSCQKEINVEDTNTGNGGNSGNNNNNSCNNTVMKIKKWQATFDQEHFIEASWNTDGTIKMIKMNVPLSEYRNATYIYENGRIKEAVLRDNLDNQIYDTAVFHYNSDGRVDSMYLKNDNWFNIKLTYNNGKLKKYTRYTDTDVMFYWDIETDTKGNIVKAVEWWNSIPNFEKESTFTFTRDDRKNPFSGLAPYMFYLDEDYNIFCQWGPNNYTNQNYVEDIGIDLTTGYKFKYNNNCYPTSSQNTVSGNVVSTNDDFLFTYY